LTSYPPLTTADLVRLLPLAKAGDQGAQQAVIDSCQTDIGKIVRKFNRRWRTVGIDDFRQQAVIGVIRAIRKCDLARADTFYAYTGFWVRAACQDLVKAQSYTGLPTVSQSQANDCQVIEGLYAQPEYLPAGDTPEAYLGFLTPTERKVVFLRHGFNGSGPLAFGEISLRVGYSRSYVNAIYNGAIRAIRNNLGPERQNKAA
jgi:DNA-directed RNA polymerase sigma subunit (sigma70/sigma32)